MCVHRDFRKRGIGKEMVLCAMKALQAEHINKVTLIAYRKNKAGNGFWKAVGAKLRDDINYYEFGLNEENITRFVEETV